MEGFEDISRRELERLVHTFLHLRVLAVAVVGAIALTVAFVDPAPWRRALLGSLVVGLLAISLVEAVRVPRKGFGPGTFVLNFGALGLFQLAMFYATGGIESPFLPACAPIVLLGTFLVGPRLSVPTLLVPMLLALTTFGFGVLRFDLPGDINPRFLGGGDRAGHNDIHVALATVMMCLVLCGSTAMGTRVRRVLFDALEAASDAREATARDASAHLRELTGLSAEIAHELKNPLASIKSLSALVATNASGRDAERIAVLRGEVDRMQVILDEFLNFSRPIVPLSEVKLDARAVLREVADVHEAVARDRDVRLVVDADPIPLRADPRKLRQVLVNLVQNAIDASPAGATVTLGAERRQGRVALTVDDRGPGVDPAVQERLFEAGVTTKPTGSGLGLVVSRALARQHGGELRLDPRPDGGTSAVVELPEVR